MFLFFLLSQMCFASRTTYQPVSARHWKPFKNVLCLLCGLSAASPAPRPMSVIPEGQESHSCSKPPKHSKSRRKPPATIDCHSLLTVTCSSPTDHFMVSHCAFQVQVWVITKQNPLCSIGNKMSFAGGVGLWHSMLPDRQARYPGELGISWAQLLGKLPN